MTELTHQYSELEKRLLNDFQQGIPMSTRPYHDMAISLGVTEQTVIDCLQRLQEQGVISRVGPVFRANRVGASTLAAMAVNDDDLERVAAQVSDYSEVNHNYQREHEFNLWFVATASDTQQLEQVMQDIEHQTQYAVMRLPMLEDYYIDLGFNISWQ